MKLWAHPSFPFLPLFFLSLPSLFPCPAECEVSEESSGEAELEQEVSDLEDLRELHPGLVMYRAAQARNLPLMAEALAHGADINWVNDEDESKTPLIQAVKGVRGAGKPHFRMGGHGCRLEHGNCPARETRLAL